MKEKPCRRRRNNDALASSAWQPAAICNNVISMAYRWRGISIKLSENRKAFSHVEEIMWRNMQWRNNGSVMYRRKMAKIIIKRKRRKNMAKRNGINGGRRKCRRRNENQRHNGDIIEKLAKISVSAAYGIVGSNVGAARVSLQHENGRQWQYGVISLIW
jgi:hypothetical protein